MGYVLETSPIRRDRLAGWPMNSWQHWRGYGVWVVREPVLEFPKPQITCPQDAFAILKHQLAWEDREIFATVILNARNHVLGINTVSVGTLNASLVHPREVFKVPIIMGAANLILAHNHPTGDTAPSREDIDLTRRLKQSGDLLGIEIFDHVIIGGTSFLSMKETHII